MKDLEICELEDMKETFSGRVVIIGGGAAAFYAASAIREKNQLCDIVIYGKEPYLTYNRPMLTKALLMGKEVEKMFIKKSQWYEEQRIDFHTDSTVTAINPANQEIVLESGQHVKYDKLLIATGATSFIPPIPGSALKGVYAIRGYEDLLQIEEAAKQASSVVVIGGGVLGLEAAWQFKKQNKQVTVLELADQLMVRQLDCNASELLYHLIKQEGMEVQVGVKIEAIVGDHNVSGVRLADQSVINADLVIMSTGIRANTALAKEAGVEINKAIVVNDHCETNLLNVYAIGDCAEHNGINYGIWPEATDMGRVAGLHSIGETASYVPAQPAIIFHGMNTQLYAIGDVGRDTSKKYQIIQLRDEAKKTYSGYYFVDQKFSGAVLFGDTKHLKQVNEACKMQESYESWCTKLLGNQNK